MGRLVPKFKAVVSNGKLLMNDKEGFDSYLSGLSGAVSVVVKKYSYSRSDKQNRYYQKVVVGLISDDTGYTKDEVHEILKAMFLGEEKEIAGQKVRVIRSTTSLTTTEFNDYVEECRRWASKELLINIPDPEDVNV